MTKNFDLPGLISRSISVTASEALTKRGGDDFGGAGMIPGMKDTLSIRDDDDAQSARVADWTRKGLVVLFRAKKVVSDTRQFADIKKLPLVNILYVG